MTTMSGAEYLAGFLKNHGVTHVFYVEAILRRSLVEMEKLGIKRILAHSEKAAAYMADGYARIALRPGVCMAQSVGAANLAAGLQDPFLGHTALIAFTGSKPPFFQYRNAYQEINHNAMFDPVTKYNVKVDTIEQLPVLLSQAFREATTGSPGPVHLDFLGYEGNLTDEAEGDLGEFAPTAYRQYPAHRPVAAEADLERAAKALEKSFRPVLVVGRGAIVSRAQVEVQRMVDSLAIPVATSVDGKAIVSDSHPLFAGPCGTYCRPCANEILSHADLVFFIGTGTGDQVTQNWTTPPPGSTIIQLDINPSEIGRNYPDVIGLMGDAKASLQKLSSLIDSIPAKEAWSAEAIDMIQAWRGVVEPYCNSDDIPVRPERLCREISELLPRDAILVADTGYTAIWAGSLINLIHADQTFIRAAGSLGWAFPAAIGAKCAAPERPVFCFSGDGAFWYHLCELETAARRGIKTVTIVNNNSRLGQSVLGIRRAYRDDPGAEEHQYAFRNTNFARIAEEMGCFGVRVERPDGIAAAIRQAMEQNKPAVVDVVTQGEAHPILKYNLYRKKP
ncbi:MAG: thiamine pyrophosphate-binding protein [Desulfobacterales bacterium]|jgi:acetolactate synthase-1/2/3 large subunit